MSKKFCCIFVIALAGVLISTNVFSQNERTVDSLKTQFVLAKHDTVKIKTLLAAGDLFKKSDPDTALYYYKMALFIATRINNQKLEVIAYRSSGKVLLNMGESDKAMSDFTKALNIATELGDKKGIADANNGLGSACYKQGQYDKATEYYLTSLKISEELGDNKETAGVYSNLGMLQVIIGHYDKGLEYYNLALKLAKETNDKKTLILIYNGIGNAYYQKFDYDKALENYLKSLDFAKKLEDNRSISRSYMNLGNVYYSQGTTTTDKKLATGLLEKALEYDMQSKTMMEAVGDNSTLAIILVNIAMIKVEIGNYKDAIEYADKSLKLAQNINALQTQVLAYDYLSQAYDSLHDYKNAYKYQKMFKLINDSIFNDDSNSKIAELQTKYETGKKETRIAQLESEKEYQDLRLKKNKIIIYSISLGGILLIAVILALFNVYKQKQTRRRMFAKIIETEEKERKHFAEELHDGLGPMLSTVSLYVNELKSDRHEPLKREEFLNFTGELVDDAIKNTRSIANKLMPGTLNDYGLVTAVETFCDKLQKSGSINISVLADKKDRRYHPAVEITLYRVILEMINNTIKHAQAKSISIDISDNDKMIAVKYHDDGQGFDFEKIINDPNKGLGLGNIQNRVKSIGGNCQLESQQGRGMQCLINVNYKKYTI